MQVSVLLVSQEMLSTSVATAQPGPPTAQPQVSGHNLAIALGLQPIRMAHGRLGVG